jgi:hypothetical protein
MYFVGFNPCYCSHVCDTWLRKRVYNFLYPVCRQRCDEKREGRWSLLSWRPENLIHVYLANDAVYGEQTGIVARRMTTPCLPERYNRLLYVYLCVNASHPGCHGYWFPWIRHSRVWNACPASRMQPADSTLLSLIHISVKRLVVNLTLTLPN